MSVVKFFSTRSNFYDDSFKFYFSFDSNLWFINIPEPNGVDDSYIFSNIGVPDGFLDRNKQFNGEKLTDFASLNDEDKWVVVSISQGLKRSLTQFSNSTPFTNEDYDFLNSSKMLTAAVKLNEERATWITVRIEDHFKKFKSLENISESQIEFFENYSRFATNSELKSELRAKIIKQSGDSNFIAKEFGIENFFTVENFEIRITEKIREAIKTGSDKGESYDFTSNIGTYSKKIDAKKNLLRLRSSGVGRKMIGWGKRSDITIQAKKLNTDTYRALEERAGRIDENPPGKTSVLYSDLLKSEIYENPTRFDFVDAFVDDTSPSKVQDIYLYNELITYYNPTSERIRWDVFKQYWGFIDPSNTYGIDDLILGYYVFFISGLEEIIKKEGELKYNIGLYFSAVVDKAWPYLMRWIVAYYENLIRYNLAKLLSETDVADIPKPDEALELAQIATDLNLQGLQGDLGDEELTEEDIQQRVQFYKQCVLLLNCDNLKNEHQKVLLRRHRLHALHNNSYYNDRFYMVESIGDNLSIKNKLISPPGTKIKPFLEITPDIASALRPRLRIYKVYKDRDGKTVSFEFPFPSHINTNRVQTFNGQEIDRGDGVGIKSFNFSFDGETPATSQQYISANLSIFFQTFSDFVKERVVPGGRSDGKEEKFRYADLFVNTKSCPPDISSTSPLNYDPQYYRIRVDVGWEPREDDGFEQILQNRGMTSTQFNEALEVMNKSFYLNLIDHEINISDSGTVNISANYIAYIEGLMENNNVLLSGDVKRVQNEFVEKLEKELRKQSCDKNQLAELKASINALRISSRKILHQSLIVKLVKNECMYSAQVDSKSRKDFLSKKFFHKKPRLLSPSSVAYKAQLSEGAGSSDVIKVAQEIKDNKDVLQDYNYIMKNYISDPKQNNMERVSFFYLSDLAYFLLDPIYEDGEPEEQIKVILSSFTIDVPFSNDVSLNIGQIPIEIEVFTKWYKNEIIDKELESISFLEFIKRLTFYLITDILSEVCIDSQQHKRMSFMNAAINSVKKGGMGIMQKLLADNKAKQNGQPQPIIDLDIPYKIGTLPLQTSALNQEKLKPTDFVQYLLIYPHHRPETHVGRAIALNDAARGVHHLYIGADRGILKNASFSKTDIQYLRESRMLTQGQNGLLQLSSLYRANLKMIGNTIFYPGMLLYLNPFGFGGMDFGLPHQGPGTVKEPNLSNIMGIGGYQKVVKVSSTISESGKFETDVECIFEHTGEAPREDANKDERSGGQRTGSEQQNPRRITCSDLDKVDKDGGACNASSYSKELQDQLFKLNNQGNIDSPEQESQDE